MIQGVSGIKSLRRYSTNGNEKESQEGRQEEKALNQRGAKSPRIKGK
jgi:hypothetical protein